MVITKYNFTKYTLLRQRYFVFVHLANDKKLATEFYLITLTKGQIFKNNRIREKFVSIRGMKQASLCLFQFVSF